MSEKKLDKSEKLRIWINKKIDESYDYSQESNRVADFKAFLAENSDFTYESHKSLYYSIMRHCFSNRGLDAATYGLKRIKIKNKDMDTTIKPKLKATGYKEQESKTSEEQKKGTESQEYQEAIEFTIDMSKEVCNFAYSILRMKYNNWEPLTEDEKNSLGTAWHNKLRQFLGVKYMDWLVPLVITAGILVKKSKEAPPAPPKKEKTVEEKNPENQQNQSEPKKSGWLDSIGVDLKSLDSAKTTKDLGKDGN